MNPAGRKMNKFCTRIENIIPALQEELLFVVSEDHKNSTFVISQPVYLTGEYMCEKRLIYIAGDGLGYGLRLGFLSYTEMGSRDPSPSLCNVNMLCIVQCSHQVWNSSLSVYPSHSPAM